MKNDKSSPPCTQLTQGSDKIIILYHDTGELLELNSMTHTDVSTDL